MTPKHLTAGDFTCITPQSTPYPLRVDIAYARPDNYLFQQAIYRADAPFLLYTPLAEAVQAAACYIFKNSGHSLILYDGLRTVEAQAAMLKTQRALDNPSWTAEPAMLSSPGAGAHPRGMAIDIGLINPQGCLCDMGSVFDVMFEQTDPTHNLSHRNHPHPEHIISNRNRLNDAMAFGAEQTGIDLHPLAIEWWDFRLPASFVNQYAPVSDTDLPNHMKLMPQAF